MKDQVTEDQVTEDQAMEDQPTKDQATEDQVTEGLVMRERDTASLYIMRDPGMLNMAVVDLHMKVLPTVDSV